MSQTSEELFKKIRGQFPSIKLGDVNAKTVNDPDQAVFFEFDFVVSGEDHGPVELRLGQDDVLYVYFDDAITSSMDRKQRKHWYEFLTDMRQFANRNMLNIEIKNISQSRLNKSDYKHLSNYEQEQTMESKMYGSKKKSYQKINDAKIIVQHRRTVDEEKMGDRSRNIKAIYIENSQGERFKFPNTYLPAARSMARHISEGGYPNDERGSHISEMMAEMLELQGFVRKARGSKYQTEDAQEVISAARDRYTALKDTMNSLKSPRGYNTYFENFQPDVIEVDENDIEDVRRKLTREVFDDRLETGLGAVGKAMKMRTTTTEAKSDSDFFNFRKWKKAAEKMGATVTGDERSGATAELSGREVGKWEWDATEKKDPGYGWIEMDMDDEGGFFDYRASNFEVPATLDLAPGKNVRQGLTAKDPKAVWTAVMMDIAKRSDSDEVVNFASRMAELIGSIGTTFGPNINDPSVKQDMQKAKQLAGLYMQAEHTAEETRRVPEFESFESYLDQIHESGSGDAPISAMSRQELIDYLGIYPSEAMDYSDEELRDAAQDLAADFAEDAGPGVGAPDYNPAMGGYNELEPDHDEDEDEDEIDEADIDENAFNQAAAAAARAGKDSFEFNGKTYKTKMDKETAHKLDDDIAMLRKLAGVAETKTTDLGYEITPRSIAAREMRKNK